MPDSSEYVPLRSTKNPTLGIFEHKTPSKSKYTRGESVCLTSWSAILRYFGDHLWEEGATLYCISGHRRIMGAV